MVTEILHYNVRRHSDGALMSVNKGVPENMSKYAAKKLRNRLALHHEDEEFSVCNQTALEIVTS